MFISRSRAVPTAIAGEVLLLATLAGCSGGSDLPATGKETSQGHFDSSASLGANTLVNNTNQTIAYAMAIAATDTGTVTESTETDNNTAEPAIGAASGTDENTDSSGTDSSSSGSNSVDTVTQTPSSGSNESGGGAEQGNTEQGNTEQGNTEQGNTEQTNTASTDSVAEVAQTGSESSGSQPVEPAENGDSTGTLDVVSPPETESTVATNTDTGADNSTDTGTTTASGDYTEFDSVTTAGFRGKQEDRKTIRVTWEADPDAKGYNVYKQAQFIDSVFTNEFVDKDVYDGDHYYEIQAFNHSDKLYYIATGLTVSVNDTGIANPNLTPMDDNFLDDYTLVFADEFQNTTLDTTRWNTAYIWGDDTVINSEEQHYVDINNEPDFGYNPFSFDGEHLTINSIRTPDHLLDKANGQQYLSGVITSYDAFKFTYGYVETRARMTHGRGYWPAFWLLNAYYVEDKPEIDIMEFIGHNQDVVYHTYHYYDANGELRSTKSEPTPGIDYTADFHTFAVDWSPGQLIFFVDGNEVHRVNDPKVSRQDMYVIANTAIGGWWPGSPDETTPFPGKYDIDYIRVYQRNTPYDDKPFLFDQPSNIPLADEGNRSPNHRPTREQWPEGYPEGL